MPKGGVPDGEESSRLGIWLAQKSIRGLSPSIITKQLSGLWCSEFGATKTLLLCPHWLLWPQEPRWLPDDRGSLQKGDENRILEKCEVHDSRGTGRKSPLAPATHLNEVPRGQGPLWPQIINRKRRLSWEKVGELDFLKSKSMT